MSPSVSHRWDVHAVHPHLCVASSFPSLVKKFYQNLGNFRACSSTESCGQCLRARLLYFIDAEMSCVNLHSMNVLKRTALPCCLRFCHATDLSKYTQLYILCVMSSNELQVKSWKDLCQLNRRQLLNIPLHKLFISLQSISQTGNYQLHFYLPSTARDNERDSALLGWQTDNCASLIRCNFLSSILGDFTSDVLNFLRCSFKHLAIRKADLSRTQMLKEFNNAGADPVFWSGETQTWSERLDGNQFQGDFLNVCKGLRVSLANARKRSKTLHKTSSPGLHCHNVFGEQVPFLGSHRHHWIYSWKILVVLDWPWGWCVCPSVHFTWINP